MWWLLSRSPPSNFSLYRYSFFLLFCYCLRIAGWCDAATLYSLYTSSHQVVQCEGSHGSPQICLTLALSGYSEWYFVVTVSPFSTVVILFRCCIWTLHGCFMCWCYCWAQSCSPTAVGPWRLCYAVLPAQLMFNLNDLLPVYCSSSRLQANPHGNDPDFICLCWTHV